MQPLQLRTILWASVIFSALKLSDCLTSRHSDQTQQTLLIDGSVEGQRVRREARDDQAKPEPKLSSVVEVVHLNNSHLHLMVHWAGKGSSVVFCLTRDPVITDNSTSHFYVSDDYGTSFTDISSKFSLPDKTVATINKFFHHPAVNCYYVFTDTKHNQIFVTRDCLETIASYSVAFSPSHVEFDESHLQRFLVHDRDGEKKELYVTSNFGQTFSKASDHIKSFFWNHDVDSTELYVSRMEPSGKVSVLSSTSFFEDPLHTSVVITGVAEFEKKGDFLFVVQDNDDKAGEKRLRIAKVGQRFVEAKFPTVEPLRDFHVCEVTEDGQILVIVNHAGNKSNLYSSDRVNPQQVEFSLSLERIFYYSPDLTWRNSWLDNTKSAAGTEENNFADFYKIAGLRGVYIASQLPLGMAEENIRPSNITTLITFDGGAEWRRVEGPRTDRKGQPIPGCYKDNDCSLHIAQVLSRKYPSTRSIPVLSSASSPGIILASANVGQSLQYKTNVFLSADAGISWHQVLQGNYYCNLGDHGGIIVAVKYFKTEGETNILYYSIDEGLTWQEHKFYTEPIRIFGVITEPGENTTTFTMFGSNPASNGSIDWIIIKVDLGQVFEKNCTLEDYKHWTPKGEGVKCLMGRRESYMRRSPQAKCYNGLSFTRSTVVETCPCGHHDYQCDFGYVRADHSSSSDCVLDEKFKEEMGDVQLPADCPPGSRYTFSRGYSKLTGDQCEGGLASQYEPQERACPLHLNHPATFMLIAQRKKILKLDLSNPKQDLEELPLIGLSNVIAMDLDYETDCVFWADIDKDVIMKQCLSNGSLPQTIVQSELASVEGMSYDHLSKILYFVDGNKRTIEMVKVDSEHTSRMRKIVLDSHSLGKPRGIAVHPTEGYIFYSDWKEKAACIGRARLDGSDHQKIVTTEGRSKDTILGWPNGLSIDFESAPSRLYFVDAQKDFVGSCRLDGSDFRKIIMNKVEVAHPFGVAVYKSLVVWNDWTKKAIFQADKLSGTGIKLVKDNVSGPMDMKIYSGRLMQPVRTECDGKECSHLCVSLPGTPEKYRCLCPDGMKVSGQDSTKCICPDGQTTQANGTCSGKNCTSDQFLCNNKLCVSRLWKCDGDNDCGDNSDERDCGLSSVCQGEGQFRCKSGKCIPGHWRCDFEDDCGDGSDEEQEQCPGIKCTSGEFSCRNGQCINKSWVCDMEKDCQDGSDEDSCVPDGTKKSCEKDVQLQCNATGTCLPISWRCDGDNDCQDNSDEEGCDDIQSCKDWQFQCNNGHCIYSTWKCDGDVDCVDQSDETDCANTTQTSVSPRPEFPHGECNEWMFKCGSQQCVPYWWKCDGVPDCDDESDEFGCDNSTVKTGDDSEEAPVAPPVVGCPLNKFQCHNGDCIWSSWVCDSQPDCQDQEDEEEEMCAGKVGCNSTQWACQLAGQCVELHQVCNGHHDCADGTDEHDCYSDNTPTSDCLDDEDHFVCDDGLSCIHWDQKCDGNTDCIDGSDEDYCDYWKDSMAIEGLEVKKDLTTNDSVSVTWRLQEGRTDISYKYAARIHGQPTWTNVSAEWSLNEKRQFTFSKLQAATEYDLRVFARNSSSEFSHAPVLTEKTREQRPSSPPNLSASQRGETLLLAWGWPTVRNGQIRSFKVRLYRDGNMLREISKSGLKEEDNLIQTSQNLTLYGLEFEVDYKVAVVAVNSEYESEESDLVSARLVNSVGAFTVEDTGTRTAKLSWTSHSNTSQVFLVCKESSNKLENSTCSSIGVPEIALKGLSPSTEYIVTVQAVSTAGSESDKSSVRLLTEGPALPVPTDLKVGPLPGQLAAVKLSWKMEQSSGKNYQFGVYYGTSLKELYNSPASLVKANYTTLTDLHSCTDYLFGVAVFDLQYHGIGKLSNPINFMTDYFPGAVPRDLIAVNNDTIKWKAPCDKMTVSVGYSIKVVVSNIYNEEKSVLSYITLQPVNTRSISHTFSNLNIPGAKYTVTVSNKASKDGRESNPVHMFGPPLPQPSSVYTHPISTGEFQVSWAPGRAMDNREYYEVVLSPDSHFSNLSCRIVLDKITNTTIKISREQFVNGCHQVDEYSIAVRTVFRNGSMEFKSAFSKSSNGIIMLDLPEPGTIVIEEKSAVGSIIGVLVVLCLMGAGIAYYAHSNRRMRYRFREFVATHYNSATGHATINHHGLMDDDDDDDSPIIRGFNDEEPLVM